MELIIKYVLVVAFWTFLWFFIRIIFKKLFLLLRSKPVKLEKQEYDIISGVVVSTKKWHEAGGIEHIELWVRDLNKKDHKVHFRDGGIDALEGHFFEICRYNGHVVYAKNMSTAESAYIRSSDLAFSLKSRSVIKYIYIAVFVLVFFLSIRESSQLIVSLISALVSIVPIFLFSYLTKYIAIDSRLKSVWENIPINHSENSANKSRHS
jgi:hypothetical protein